MTTLSKHDDLMSKTNEYKNRVFVGIVVFNNDPNPEMQRVKVLVPKYMDDEVTNLPWCLPAVKTKASGGRYSMEVPEIGTEVYITFQDGNSHFPMYTPGFTKKGVAVNAKLLENFPNSYGFQDSTGNVFYVNEVTKEVGFHHNSGSFVVFKPNGDTEIHSSNNIIASAVNNVTVTGKVVSVQASQSAAISAPIISASTPSGAGANFNSDGSMDVNSSSAIRMVAPRIDLN